MGKFTANFDWIGAILLLCLGLMGLFLMLTIGVNVFTAQLLYLVIGLLLLFLLSTVDPVLLWWFAPYGYVIGIILLILSYLGPNIRGATRWIVIGGAQLQPSELAKPLFLLAFSYLMTRFSPRQLKYLPIHLALFIVPFLLVFKQPDLGSGIVYSASWIAMLIAGGLPIFIIVVAVIIGVMLAPFLWNHLLPYQKDRIFTFLNPALDPKGAGYNALQAMIAVGSGQLIGRGLGRGTQSQLRFLPEHHTDFIFATLIEELGFVGGIVLFLLYMLLMIRIIMPFIIGKISDVRVFIYSFGLFAMLFAQIFINAGMNMGIIPITGITLPFVSYGGSSILSLSISFGILWALQRRNSAEQTIAIG